MRWKCTPARPLHLGEDPGQPGQDPARHQGRDALGRCVAPCQTNRQVICNLSRVAEILHGLELHLG